MAGCALARAFVLDAERYRAYVESFHANDPEDVAGEIPNARAWEWMRANVPLFACPDADVERTYYFRWWTFRKHIKRTPEGCAFGHHVAEARWLHDRRYLDGHVAFWLKGGPRANFHQFSGWAAA